MEPQKNAIIYRYQPEPSPWSSRLLAVPLSAIKSSDGRERHEGAKYFVKYKNAEHPALVLEVLKNSTLQDIVYKLYVADMNGDREKEERGENLALALGLISAEQTNNAADLFPAHAGVQTDMLVKLEPDDVIDFDRLVHDPVPQNSDPASLESGLPLSVALAVPEPIVAPLTDSAMILPVQEISDGPNESSAADKAEIDWLCEVSPRRIPYFPQTGDTLIYFVREHEAYNKMILNTDASDVLKNNCPWNDGKLQLKAVETIKVTKVRFFVAKPSEETLAELTVRRQSDASLESPKEFPVFLGIQAVRKGFLVLKKFVDGIRSRRLCVGQRVRTISSGQGWSWRNGTVIADTNLNLDSGHWMEDIPEARLSLEIRFDSRHEGDTQTVSFCPWNIFPLEIDGLPEPVDGSSITPEEVKKLAYTPEPSDWAYIRVSSFRQRVMPLLDQLIDCPIAQRFKTWESDQGGKLTAVTRPISLTMIKQRLDNVFYRTRAALIQDFDDLVTWSQERLKQNYCDDQERSYNP